MNFDVLSPTFSVDNAPFGFDPLADCCGVGRLACLIPQAPFGIQLRAACFVHDQRWDVAKSWDDFWNSAEEFKQNVKQLCIAQHHHILAPKIADVFYFGVTNVVSEEIFKCELKARGIIL